LLADGSADRANEHIRALAGGLHYVKAMKTSTAQGARVDPADYPRFNLQPITSIDSPQLDTHPTGSLGLKLRII
jgi:hypothetical protein